MQLSQILLALAIWQVNPILVSDAEPADYTEQRRLLGGSGSGVQG